WFRRWLTGAVTPPRAALVGLAVVCLAAMGIGWRAAQPLLMIAAFALIALIVVVVALRFAFKGPELDRALPFVSVSHTPLGHAVQIGNIDPGMMASLLQWVAANRQPLPAPSGIVTGSAADPSAILEIAPDEEERLNRLDMG